MATAAAASPEKWAEKRDRGEEAASSTTPAEEELLEFERLLEEGGSCGSLKAGSTYYLVSRRWLDEWRRGPSQSSSQAHGRPRSHSPPPAAASSGAPGAGGAGSEAVEPPPGLGSAARPPPGRRRPASAEGVGEGRSLPESGDCAESSAPGGRPQERPPPIDNQPLLEASGELRAGARKGLDFEAVPARAWELLQQRYGGGPAIPREAVRQASGELRLEVRGLLLRARRTSERAPSFHAELAPAATVAELKGQLCRKLGRSEEQVCLWQEQEGGRLRLLESSQGLTIEASGLQEDALLVLDERQANGSWPLGAASVAPPPPPLQPPVAPAPATGMEEDEEEAPAGLEALAEALAGAEESEEASTPPPLVPVEGRGGSGSSSAAKPRASWPAKRTAGIANLGNTCFMGSSLQCLANVPALRDYFLSDNYREALRVPGASTEPSGGRLAEGFATLLRRLWRGDGQTVSPWTFKELVERIADRFSGYRQHDSMEFVEFLIDGLKEDCNRVKGKKPYVERADADGRPDSQVALEAANGFLLRSDSDVDDLFVGFEKITTTCPDCGRESVVFDPFLSVKVPLTSPRADHEVKFAVTVVPLASPKRPPPRLRVAARRCGPAGSVVEAAAARAGLEPGRCVLFEARGTRLRRLLEDDDGLEDLMPFDALILLELDQDLAHLLERARRRQMPMEDAMPAEVLERLEEAALRAERHSFETRLETCFEWLTEREQLSEHDSVYCSKCKEHRQVFRKVEFWSLPPVLVLQLKRFEFSSVMRRRLSTPVHFPVEGLDLSRFCLSEDASFPEGHCLRAGQRVAICGLQSAAGQKMNGVEGVAMYLDTGTSRWCVRLQEGDPSADWKRLKAANLQPVPPEKPGRAAPRPVYDLVAVSKHMGATSFGHYVAFARSCEDGAWRLFDDDEVREVEAGDVEAEIEGAYVLFYLRRDCRPPAWGQAKG